MQRTVQWFHYKSPHFKIRSFEFWPSKRRQGLNKNILYFKISLRKYWKLASLTSSLSSVFLGDGSSVMLNSFVSLYGSFTVPRETRIQCCKIRSSYITRKNKYEISKCLKNTRKGLLHGMGN